MDEKGFAEAVCSCRFENLSEGRKRGEENIAAHTRKGIAGDWQNYFTPKIKIGVQAALRRSLDSVRL